MYSRLLQQSFLRGEAYIEVPVVTATGLQAAVMFVYNGEVSLTDSNVGDIRQAADILEIPELQVKCKPIIETNEYQHHDVSFYADKFHELMKPPSLPSVPLDVLKRLLAADYLRVSSEYELFRTVVRWLDIQQRRGSKLPTRVIQGLLSQLRYASFTAEELRDVLEDRHLSDESCRQLKMELTQFSAQKHSQSILRFASHQTRNSSPCVLLIGGGFTDSKPRSAVLAARIQDGGTLSAYSEVCELPNAPLGTACVTQQNYVFVLGGQADPGHFASANNTVIRINTRTMETFEMPPMKEPRTQFTAEILPSEQGILVIGGLKGGAELSSVERYNFRAVTWQRAPRLTSGRYGHASCVCQGLVFVTGGVSDGGVTSGVWTYHELQDTWRECAPFFIKRSHHVSGATTSTVFVCGGWAPDEGSRASPVLEVEMYNIGTAQWSLLSITLPRGISHTKCVMIKDDMYLIGGSVFGDAMLINTDLEEVTLLQQQQENSQKHVATCYADLPTWLLNK